MRAFAPGRTNLIGEHTDYNDGLCLPFAIRPGVTVWAAPRSGDQTRVQAPDLGEEDRFNASAPGPAAGWRALVRGVAEQLQAPPAEVEIRSELPMGAGLGSSAAMCVALALALGAEGSDGLALAELCAQAERRAGAATGLLDQLASIWGAEGHALRLDMRSPRPEPVAFGLAGWTLAVLDSGAPRANASSGYNRRRRECGEACRLLGVASLRDAGAAQHGALPAPLDRRACHVLEENARVEAAARALAAGDGEELGRLLDASHRSLRDLYEVSVPEVERTVAAAKEAGAAGARIHGGGFGGGVLALFPPGRRPPSEALEVTPGPGARLLSR